MCAFKAIRDRVKEISFNDPSKFTRAQKFIEQNKKKLEDSSVFFNPDTAFQPAENYSDANLRVLIVFGSPASVKAVSSTAAALNSFVTEICNSSRTKEQNSIPKVNGARPIPEPNERGPLKVFMDFTYVPKDSDMKLFDKNNMPYAIGNITHLDASYFDVVGFSISVLSEVITCPNIIKSFSRCDYPIPLTWTERKGETLGKYPLIYAGGITAACSDIMFGDLGDGRQAFVDFLYLGSCEKMDIMWERHIEAIDHNRQIDEMAVSEGEEISPFPPLYQHNGVDLQGLISTQDYINSIFDMPMVYQPQAYKVVFDNRNRVIENTKINEYAQDFVKPYYPLEIDEDCLGIGMTIIQASGDNVGTSQIQVSEGCSAAGACSFCAEGNYCLPAGTLIKSTEGLTKIEDFKVGDYVVLSENKFKVLNKVTIEPKILKKIELFNHQVLKVADTHLMLTIENGKLRYKRAYDLKEGDFLVYDRTQAFGSFKTDYAYLIGLIIGDGMFYPDKKTIEVDFPNFDISSSIDGEFERLCDKWHYSKKTDDCSAAVCYSDKITKELIAIGLNHQTAKSKRIPEKFFNSDKETAKCLLQGLFDSDGGISLNKSGKASIYYSSVNYDLIEDVVKMLSMFGIVASIYPSDRDEGGHFKKDGEFIKNSEATYDVVIVGEKNQQIFEDEIGFRLERKRNLLLQRFPYEWDVEYLPTFERRIKDLYLSNKEFNRFTRKNNDSLRKVVMGWTTKMHWLSKRHLLKGMEFYDKELLDDIEDAKRFEFIQIIDIEDGEKEQMYDIEVEDSHAYSIHGWVSHNTGGWVEKSKERILWEARESKKYSAGYKMKPFSFNCNYVTDYKGILYDFMKIYPKVTFINMRMEELGRDVDALRMMKLVGSNRISAPMEGISPRIQNNLLNKCLSEEALTNFMDDMVHARLTDIKVGGIFTGYEEDEDFQWICDFVDRYKQRAAMENGNFPFRLKVTPLVHYNLTPIEYLERKSARKSYEGEHWLTDEWYEKFREHNVFFKVNGFRYSTFIEQSIIDLGRSATKWMYDNIVSQNLPVYSLRSFATKEIVDNLKKIVNKDWFFEARNPEHYISISHRIHIDLMGSYIPRARRLVRLAEQGKILDNPMDIRCLKTFADAKTKCYASCVSKDPLKIYKDVKLDENDNLVGEFRELKGCERCPDKEHRMNRLARPIISSKNSEDIIALPKLKPVQRVRFVLRRTAEYCVLNPNNTAHTFMAKFLQKSERLVDIYHSIAGHNFFWQSDADIPYEVSGFQVVDALFTSNEAYSIIESFANEVSRELKSVKIISFKKEFVEDTIKVNDFNIYRFETSLPYDLFASACISYKGEIRVKKDVLLETITDKSLKKPVFITAGKTIGYFVLPMKYNPYLYLQGLLKDKKIPLTKLRQEVNIDNVLIARESSNICTCGKEKGVISLITGKQMKFGLDCLPTALMKVELNKKK